MFKYQEKMVKGGYWDIPAFIVGCYGFYVLVQCFFPTFAVLCGGNCGTILPLTFTSLFGLRWGGELFRLFGFYVWVWAGHYFIIIYVAKILWINHVMLSSFLFHPTSVQLYVKHGLFVSFISSIAIDKRVRLITIVLNYPSRLSSLPQSTMTF